MNKILIVEDESDLAELIRYNLEKDGYQVELAVTGEEALASLKNSIPNLVVLDLMLPGIQGIDVLKQVRANPAMESLPIIILSAKTSEVDRVLGLELGADDYIGKPFSVKELASRIKAVLRRSAPADAEKKTFKYKSLAIDFSSVTVKVNGKPVHLSPYEFKILAFLVLNPDKTFSRDQLLNSVWEDNAFVQPRTVDVHIRRLRTLIEKDPANPEIIKTVRGFGYIFQPK